MEIILVDDGSPDRCPALCDEIAKTDHRIKVIHKENGGLSSARNAGLDVMTGEYVGFVDSDDTVDPEMYEILYNRLVNEDAQISCCGIGKYRNETLVGCFNQSTTEEMVFDNVEAQRQRILNFRISNSMCDKLFQADLFGKLRMKVGMIHEDEQLMPYILLKAKRVAYTARPMYHYNMSDTSILRGNFSLKRYDLYLVSLDRIALYEKHYPQFVNIAKAIHLDICLSLIFGSRKTKEWDEKRIELIGFVKQPIDDSVEKCLSGKTKLNIRLLKTSPLLFTAFNNITVFKSFLMMRFPHIYTALRGIKSKIRKREN